MLHCITSETRYDNNQHPDPRRRRAGGSFFPSLRERRRRVDQSLFAVIIEACLGGTLTHKVDDLVKALGADSGISRPEVSRDGRHWPRL
jgi:transposase-like protein